MLHKTNFDQVSTKEGSKPDVLYHLIRGTQICRPRSTSYIAVSVYHSKPRVIAEILGFTYKSKLFVAEIEANGSLDCVSRKGQGYQGRSSNPLFFQHMSEELELYTLLSWVQCPRETRLFPPFWGKRKEPEKENTFSQRQ